MPKLLFSIFFFICCLNGLAQYSFKGVVLSHALEPLKGVSITLGKTAVVGVTDSSGYFHFNYTSNNFLLSFSHVGFITKAITVKLPLPDTILLQSSSELLDETVIKAYGHNNTSNNLAASVAVLNKEALERSGAPSFVNAMNTVAGVKMDERSPGSYRLSIRGNLLRSTFGVRNVKVYWNGIPFTDASGITYFNQLSLKNIDRVEIIKGPSGSMYGSGTGGVVLLSSGESSAKKQQWFDAEIVSGNYGLVAGNASFHQSGKNQTGISIAHQQADGYRNHSKMQRSVAHYTGSYLLNSKQKINANIFYSDLFYQTPGGLTLAEMKVDPRFSRPAAGAFQSAATQKAAIYLKTIYAGLSHEINLNNRWSNTTSVYGSYTDFKNPNIRNYEKKYEKGLGGRTLFQYESGIFKSIIGGELQQGDFNSTVYGNRAGERDSIQFTSAVQSRQFNLFAQSSISLPGIVDLITGVSYNRFYYGYHKTSDALAQKESSAFKPQLVPRVSLLKKIKTTSVYLAVSKGYSVPSIDEVNAGNDIFNAALKAETGLNYEAGAKTTILKNKLWVDAAFYIFTLQNTIVSRRDLAGGDYFTNAGRTKQQGTEITIHFIPVQNTDEFIETVQLNGSYTNINARFKNYQRVAVVYDGNRLTGTPPNVFVLNADLICANGFYANLGYNFTDHIPLNDANSFYAVSYQLLMAKLGYKAIIKKNNTINIYLSAVNAFNNPYSLGNDLNAAANRYYNPSAASQYNFGIQYRFNVNPGANR